MLCTRRIVFAPSAAVTLPLIEAVPFFSWTASRGGVGFCAPNVWICGSARPIVNSKSISMTAHIGQGSDLESGRFSTFRCHRQGGLSGTVLWKNAHFPDLTLEDRDVKQQRMADITYGARPVYGKSGTAAPPATSAAASRTIPSSGPASAGCRLPPRRSAGASRTGVFTARATRAAHEHAGPLRHGRRTGRTCTSAGPSGPESTGSTRTCTPPRASHEVLVQHPMACPGSV